MSGSARFNAIVGIKDETLAPLRAIGARFAAIAQQTGITRIAGSLAAVGRSMAGLAASAGQVAAPIAAIGATAATVGLISITRRTADAAGALADLSMQTGVSVGELQELSDAARLAGVDQGTLAGALQRLNRGLAEAANGGGGDLGPMLRQLGISMRDSNGQIRNAADLLPELADAFERNESQALRSRAATELFGRAGVQLIPMLANGRKALEESRGRFRQFGFSMADNAEALALNSDQFENLQVATEGLSHAIGARLAPILGPIADRMARWVVANRNVIATDIGKWATDVSASLSAFFAERGPLDRLRDFAATIGRVVDALGGVQNVLIGFGAIAALPFVAALTSILTAFAPVLAAVGRLALALGAGSPVGIAILALAASAFVIRKNWEPIAAFFEGVWRRISTAVTTAWETMRPIVNAVRDAADIFEGGRSPTGPVASPDAQQQRSNNWRSRGVQRIEGFDDEPPPSVGPRLNGLPPMPPSVLPQLAPLSSFPALQGQVTVDVNINNLPPGSRAEATSSGPLVRPPNTAVGWALGRPPR